MMFVTSLSPKHISIKTQEEAVESWKGTATKIYSLNCKSEILVLKEIAEYSEVEFIEVERTRLDLFNKPVVQIKEILTFINKLEVEKDKPIAIINSDIIIKENKEINNKIKEYTIDSLVFISRYNFKEKKEDSIVERWGFDIFISTKSIFSTLLKEVNDIYCMGVCFWDYWMPYTCIKKGIKTVWLNKQWAYHREHQKQWSKKDWLICVSTFRKEEKIVDNNIRQTGNKVRKIIINKSRAFE